MAVCSLARWQSNPRPLISEQLLIEGSPLKRCVLRHASSFSHAPDCYTEKTTTPRDTFDRINMVKTVLPRETKSWRSVVVPYPPPSRGVTHPPTPPLHGIGMNSFSPAPYSRRRSVGDGIRVFLNHSTMNDAVDLTASKCHAQYLFPGRQRIGLGNHHARVNGDFFA